MEKTLSERIFWLQSVSGLSAREFDRVAGVLSGTLNLLRHRRKTNTEATLSISAVLAYAEAYSAPLDWLLLGKGRPPKETTIRRRARTIATTSTCVNPAEVQS